MQGYLSCKRYRGGEKTNTKALPMSFNFENNTSEVVLLLRKMADDHYVYHHHHKICMNGFLNPFMMEAVTI